MSDKSFSTSATYHKRKQGKVYQTKAAFTTQVFADGWPVNTQGKPAETILFVDSSQPEVNVPSPHI